MAKSPALPPEELLEDELLDEELLDDELFDEELLDAELLDEEPVLPPLLLEEDVGVSSLAPPQAAKVIINASGAILFSSCLGVLFMLISMWGSVY